MASVRRSAQGVVPVRVPSEASADAKLTRRGLDVTRQRVRGTHGHPWWREHDRWELVWGPHVIATIYTDVSATEADAIAMLLRSAR
jgi:hypothetical protein